MCRQTEQSVLQYIVIEKCYCYREIYCQNRTRKNEPVQPFALCITCFLLNTRSPQIGHTNILCYYSCSRTHICTGLSDQHLEIWFLQQGLCMQSKLGHFDCVLNSKHRFLGLLLVRKTTKQTKKKPAQVSCLLNSKSKTTYVIIAVFKLISKYAPPRPFFLCI